GLIQRVMGSGVVLLVAACSAPAPISAPTQAPPPTVVPTVAPTSAPAAATAVPAATVAPAASATSAPATAAPAASASKVLPSLIPSQAINPALPPPLTGVDAGYLGYPHNPPASVTETPGAGSVVNMLTFQYTPPVAALDQNAALQELNKRLGAEV